MSDEQNKPTNWGSAVISVPNSSPEGKKHDSGKPQAELIPVPGLLEVIKVLTFGATKYDPWNWAKGMKWSRLIGAILRHTFAYMMGETRDPETGLSHMAHVACSALFLITYEQRSLGEDDRHKYETKPTVDFLSAQHVPSQINDLLQSSFERYYLKSRK